ncbi:MAG: nucleotidyl transferase AbiEii/AbiGii toxin family protein [Ignavibacteriaceae bacterium]|nr:nucleotidyl transferase AbiEii/AbiGii toxin family protein [Ignavibacteriaceae bacterium]
MNLHSDIKLFGETIRAASQHLKINVVFVEKDYWISLVLSRLAKSKYSSQIVFKGGTSLSKGFGLIDRFSEDIDIAIIDEEKKSGNEIRTLIRTVEKEMTNDLAELQMDGVTSKGSRFRKSVFEYPPIDAKNKNNNLIVEINSFTNPFPFHPKLIKSMICDFLTQTGNDKFVEQYDLQPFEINVLNKEQTMLEKIVSLIRFSFEQNVPESLSKKIRHFYDLYFLMQDKGCAAFVKSDNFRLQFNQILNHDKELFDEPKGWQTKSVSESILISDFDNIWNQLKDNYNKELSALAYKAIPDEKKVAESLRELIKLIQ